MIPGIPQVGGLELFILMMIILLFFGAKRVPELARSIGRGKREFHKGIQEAEAKEEREQAEARQVKEESPAPEEARSEAGSVPEEEKPKTGPSAKA